MEWWSCLRVWLQRSLLIGVVMVGVLLKWLTWVMSPVLFLADRHEHVEGQVDVRQLVV